MQVHLGRVLSTLAILTVEKKVLFLVLKGCPLACFFLKHEINQSESPLLFPLEARSTLDCYFIGGFAS